MNSVIFDSSEVQDIFGPVSNRENILRIAMQMSRFNRKAAQFQLFLRFDRETKNIHLSGKSVGQIEKFSAYLLSLRGPVQKKFSLRLSEKLNLSSDSESSMRAVIRRQAAAIKSLSLPPGIPFDFFDLSSFWVNPPYGLSGRRAPDPSILKDLDSHLVQASSSKAIFLTGGVGSGKTSILIRSFLKAFNFERSYPLFVPARCLSFREETLGIEWAAIPGVEASDSEHLKRLFEAGELLLFVDGLDENPKSFDFSDPKVVSFWRRTAKNRCVISCRDSFWGFYAKPILLKEIFLNQILAIQLAPWGDSQFLELCSRLAQAFKVRGKHKLATVVRNLPVENRFEPVIEVGGGPLGAWVIIAGCLQNNFMWDFQKRMDYLILNQIIWEAEKPSNLFFSETAIGILSLVASHIFEEGGMRASWHISPEELWKLTARKYPFFESKKSEFFASFERLPFVSYDGLKGVFNINPMVGRFLACGQKPSWERSLPADLKLYQGSQANL